MSLFHLILVAVIQGLTEFLPVSSSGHLILLPGLTGMEDQGQAIDVAVHVGTLFAVVLYFWADVKIALSGIPRLIRGRVDTQGAWLAMCLAIATVPVLIFGLILHITGLDDMMPLDRGDRLDHDHIRAGALLGGSKGRHLAAGAGMVDKTRRDHGVVASTCADSRNLAIRGDHFGSAGPGLCAGGWCETCDADVDPDDPGIGPLVGRGGGLKRRSGPCQRCRDRCGPGFCRRTAGTVIDDATSEIGQLHALVSSTA